MSDRLDTASLSLRDRSRLIPVLRRFTLRRIELLREPASAEAESTANASEDRERLAHEVVEGLAILADLASAAADQGSGRDNAPSPDAAATASLLVTASTIVTALTVAPVCVPSASFRRCSDCPQELEAVCDGRRRPKGARGPRGNAPAGCVRRVQSALLEQDAHAAIAQYLGVEEEQLTSLVLRLVRLDVIPMPSGSLGAAVRRRWLKTSSGRSEDGEES